VKKEIDTWKLDRLFAVYKNATLSAWYFSGAIIATLLWLYPLENTRIQAFAFLAIFMLYTLMSVCISKLESIRAELK
jgi:hypothetical protein